MLRSCEILYVAHCGLRQQQLTSSTSEPAQPNRQTPTTTLPTPRHQRADLQPATPTTQPKSPASQLRTKNHQLPTPRHQRGILKPPASPQARHPPPAHAPANKQTPPTPTTSRPRPPQPPPPGLNHPLRQTTQPLTRPALTQTSIHYPSSQAYLAHHTIKKLYCFYTAESYSIQNILYMKSPYNTKKPTDDNQPAPIPPLLLPSVRTILIFSGAAHLCPRYLRNTV